MSGESPNVLVVGAVNVDLVVTTPARPSPGETVLGTSLVRHCGGKGANQAVAAARAGARASLVGSVGDDVDGETQVRELQRVGVDVSKLSRHRNTPTGCALVVVTPDGENSIVVVPGANAQTTAHAMHTALADLPSGTVLVLQSEVGAEVVDAAAAIGLGRNARLVVNLAPVVAMSATSLACADPLVVNETEARQLGDLGDGIASTALAGLLRRSVGARSVVVTLGAEGAVFSTADGEGHVPAVPARVVDTTGAGDAFIGTLAATLAAGDALPTALHRAAAASAEVVEVVGARPHERSRPEPLRT